MSIAVGKAARRRRQHQPGPGAGRASRTPPARRGGSDPRSAAETALTRLVQSNPPGKVSLAGAYALGYAALGMAQQEGDGPDWYHELDPIDTLFLGTVWPQEFRDGYEFANARSAWLRLLRGTVQWTGIERFIREVLAASDDHDLPVDEGDLMLLVAGRLEAAGLDQRKLPRGLLPATALAGSRVALGGPTADAVLPPAPRDAAGWVARLWAAPQVGLPHDGTACDALREGLHLLAASGLDVHAEPMVLLPALYLGLAANDDEELDEAADRAVAWALGLAEDSPLVPITDILLTAPGRGLDPDTVLGHLFAIAAFTEPVPAADRRWHSWPGTALVDLAFELGYDQVNTRDSKVLRLDQDQKAMLEAQFRRFEEKFGRPPGLSDPVFFDPNADQPQPMSLPAVETATVGMLESAGVCPAWVYAYQHTDGLLPRPDGTFATQADQAEWDETVARYLSLHQPGTTIDHQAETRKLQQALTGITLTMADDDPGYGASLAAALASGQPAAGSDAALLSEFLHTAADYLGTHLRTDPAVSSLACEYARAWAGANLADRVHDAAHAHDTGHLDDGVLLATAVAVIHKEQS
ncbi:MAG TPA: hypothetical protein VGS19_23205 [Streptosporangiaceae bacterium]|nr:hypothetical protein [Streptosporangiaceae bacterium]